MPTNQRIIFLSSSDPLEIRSFSGVLFHMVKALREIYPGMEVVRSSRPNWFNRLQRLLLKMSHGRLDPYYWRTLNRMFARRLAKQWRGQQVLVIAAVNASLVSELAALVPVINVTDSTFELMRDYYLTFSKLDSETAAQAEQDEYDSIRLSVHNTFSSHWAANSAVSHYGADPQKVSVIPWGCNLDPVSPEDVRPPDSRAAQCRLLFIGGDWMRKGGDIVLAASKILIERGFPLHVTLVGAHPPEGKLNLLWLDSLGFLSKGDEAQFDVLKELMRKADFLFLPTRQDCTPMVFAECNAYGTPAITRDVGGVSDVVLNRVNGFALPENADASDFADLIESTWMNAAQYSALRRSARSDYEKRLNWRVWAAALQKVIKATQGEAEDRG